jgi:bifunctional UDP-N-acetylglucosamine pyrophosphorylase / glucosamine-1-phosphate N-acetyltransferase
METTKISAVILAAGKGTRMKSSQAKVLHELNFQPMLHHVLDAVVPLDLHQVVVVTGHQRQVVEDSCKHYHVDFVEQTEQLGTGHAVLAAEEIVKDDVSVVMVLCGDTPLIRTETLHSMLSGHISSGHFLTVMTTEMDNPTNYGRILVDDRGYVSEIVEEKDASPDQKKIKNINAGIYCVNAEFLFASLKQIGTDNKQGEMYLTDIVALAAAAEQPVHKYQCPEPEEVLGVNSRHELSMANSRLQSRVLEQLMISGVSIDKPDTVTVEKSVCIGQDTVLYPNVYLSGKTIIGSNCTVEPFCYITGSEIGNNVTIGAGSYVKGATLDNDIILPPHTVMVP